MLFVGEAPGNFEDALALPFVGDSGLLLDDLIYDAIERLEIPLPTIGYTNLVACRPQDKRGNIRAPSAPEIEACSHRLNEFIKMASPVVIVSVGKLAKGVVFDRPTFEIQHPASLLRIDKTLFVPAYMQTITALCQALEIL